MLIFLKTYFTNFQRSRSFRFG